MKAWLHSVLLIAGTEIGAGFIALPMVAVNLGLTLATVVLLAMMWTSYWASMMLIELNFLHQKPASVVELSRQYAGKGAFVIALVSFYGVCFGALVAYFACITDTLRMVVNIPPAMCIGGLGIALLLMLCLRAEFFARFNSLLVFILLGFIVIAVVTIGCAHLNVPLPTDIRCGEMVAFLPIAASSFCMQMVCPHVYTYLQGDRKRIRSAFLAGVVLPLLVYVIWIVCVLKNVAVKDPAFYQRLQAHTVSVGDLNVFLCDSSHSASLNIFFKILVLSAVATSMLGIAIGLMESLRLMVPKKFVRICVICLLPVMVNWFIPNAFVPVLSVVGLLVATFAIVLPYVLMKKQQQALHWRDHICCTMGIAVIACELYNVLKPHL